MRLRAFDRLVIPRIRMRHHAGAIVVPEHARNSLTRFFLSVTSEDDAAVLREAYAYAP